MLRLTATLGNPLRLIGSGVVFGERLVAAERRGESSIIRRRLAGIHHASERVMDAP